MTGQDIPDIPVERAPRGLAAKREAIARAACAVFGRVGFTAAGVDAIAAEAGVSKRTVYNHFAGKEELFVTTVRESGALVSEALTRVIEHHLDDPADVREALIALGEAWADAQRRHADRFALSRWIGAEAPQLPAGALAAWHEAGPERAQNALALRLRYLAERGRLSATDSARAANHYIWLVLGEVTDRARHGSAPLPPEEVTEMVTSGVDAFLHGYLPR